MILPLRNVISSELQELLSTYRRHALIIFQGLRYEIMSSIGKFPNQNTANNLTHP